MNKKYDALDWQSFSQKKDIEEIVKNTRDKNALQITATIEIAMTVSSIVAQNLFNGNTPDILWVIIFFISIIPLIWLAYKYILKIYKKLKPGNDIPSLSSMIDLFDNEICYYALMADSYADKLDNIDKTEITAIIQFNFIETCFYVNKTIYNLTITSNSVDKLYSLDCVDLYNNRKISYTRLKNILNIIDLCLDKINRNSFIITNIDQENNYVKLCEEYIKS